MAKVRAYKIAEELGLEKDEFLRRAGEIGISLRSALVGIEEDQADEIRRRLGGKGSAERVETRVGTGVIRRRRKKLEAPVPEGQQPQLEASSAVAEAPPAPVALEAPGAPEIPDAGLLVAKPSTPAVDPLADPELSEGADPETPIAEPAKVVPRVPAPTVQPSAAPKAAEPAAGGREPDPAKSGLLRRQVLQGVTLREQESIARMMQGNVQRRLEQRRQIVEQQARLQPRRRRAAAVAKSTRVPTVPQKKVLRIEGSMQLAEISRRVGVRIGDLQRSLRTLNVAFERDTLVPPDVAELLAAELGIAVQLVTETVEDRVAAAATGGAAPEPRNPVITVMGHVDHGKTSLLDALRNTRVAEGESGGITQHIGAYSVQIGDRGLTFIDTPGHEAFTHMRARGAQVTDIAVLVVAADDGIMPQTVEAISHAVAAEVPILVAINKIDKAEADAARVKQALLTHDLVPEEFGGDTICVEVSATQRTGLDKLLEMLALQSEILELNARRSGRARGVVIEAQLDRGRGPVATVLVREGTLTRGDAVVVGTCSGRVRSLLDESGNALKEAGPSTPVQVVGLSGVPDGGDELLVVKNEREAKDVVEHRIEVQRQADVPEPELGSEMDADALFAQLGAEEEQQLTIVLKSDVRGTMEAVRDLIRGKSGEKLKVDVVHAGVGAINESDVTLAIASSAVVVGFHVRPEPAARKLAEQEGIDVRLYEVVYDLIDDVTGIMLGLLPPKLTDKIEGHAEVRQLFQIPRVGTIAGCFVPEGLIKRANLVRVVRDGVVAYSGRLASLRRVKDDVREVQSGLECGMRIENYNDVKVGDILESFIVEETADTL